GATTFSSGQALVEPCCIFSVLTRKFQNEAGSQVPKRILVPATPNTKKETG
ncbi:6510_t:CDS:1, partial [Gigaspora rosea]